MILAGDVGGTKTELAIFEDVFSRKILKEESFFSNEHGSLEEIIEKFLSFSSFNITHACFGIAGPIKNNTCFATNLPWVIKGDSLQSSTKIPHVFLLNDLEANAWGISCLHKEEIYTLSEGKKNKEANQALISAGTGLGEAGLYFDGKKHCPFPSEGGHCSFAPSNEEEIELLIYFKSKIDHVSYERFLSGRGLVNIYRFWTDGKKEKELPEVQKKMLEEDPAKVISEYGSTGKCPICTKTLHRFLSIYGSEAGNLALKFSALGGIYIGGGIAPKILDNFKNGPFLDSLKNKGRLGNMLGDIPVHIILNSKAALFGAALYAESKI